MRRNWSETKSLGGSTYPGDEIAALRSQLILGGDYFILRHTIHCEEPVGRRGNLVIPLQLLNLSLKNDSLLSESWIATLHNTTLHFSRNDK